MDYGQFSVGGVAGAIDEGDLLRSAFARPPSASDGQLVVVTSPHQNNFAMLIDVEVWSARPDPDWDHWEQASVEDLDVDEHGAVIITSPTSDVEWCEVAPGPYLVEVCGRGFVTYGWPGSTKPGDRWRLRFWPDVDDRFERPAPKTWPGPPGT